MTGEQSDTKKLLNPVQRGRLATTLSTLEEMLCEIERDLIIGGCKGILYEVRDDVPDPARKNVLRSISLIRERISVMAQRFALERRSTDVSRNAMGKLAYGWEILEGAKSGYLHGSGAVAEGLSEVLDPQLGGIVAILNEMRDLMAGEKKV